MESDESLDLGRKVDKIFEMLMDLQPIIKKLEDFGVVKVLEEKVEKLEREIEKENGSKLRQILLLWASWRRKGSHTRN
jgi:hypothetical protein